MSWLSRILGLGVRPENSIKNRDNQNLSNEDISIMNNLYQAQLDESAKKISNLEEEVAKLQEEVARTRESGDSSNSSDEKTVKLGSKEYELDEKKRAEDILPDDVLSKEAKTLPSDEQLKILKEAGIDVNNLTINEAQDKTVSFSKDNIHYRVVDDKGTKKIIKTTINNNKASTEVSKLKDNGTTRETNTPTNTPRETNTPSENTNYSMSDIVSMQGDVDRLQSYIEDLDYQISELSKDHQSNKGAIKVLQDEKKNAQKLLDETQTKLMRAKLKAGMLGSGNTNRRNKSSKSGLEKFNDDVKTVKNTADSLKNAVNSVRDLFESFGSRRNRYRSWW